MTKFFSPLKALKVGLTSLALAGSCLVANTVSAAVAPGFVRTQGNQIVDGAGNPIFFNGTNLGNWLVWEGYMLMNNDEYRTHTQFFWGLETAFNGLNNKTGTANAIEFEKAWRDSYVTQKTIAELHGLGYNSVRVPFNWKLVWDDSSKSLKPEGMAYIQNLISWCEPLGVKILLDMHGLPGYQNTGDHSDNLDSKAPDDAYNYTVRFLEKNANGVYNYSIAGDAWREIARTFKDNKTIWGYDIMNEPNTGGFSEKLLVAQKDIIAKIREVDANHIVVVEGDNWGGYMDMYSLASSGWNGSLLDSASNVVIQTHYYRRNDTVDQGKAHLAARVKIANDINVPIILGEFGEDTEENLRQFANSANAQSGYDGSFTWTFKKVSHLYRSLWVVNPQQGRSNPENAFLELRSAIAGNRKFMGNWEDLMSFVKFNTQNGHAQLEWWQKFYDYTTNSTVGLPLPPAPPAPICTRSAYKAVTLPGSVEAEDFDNGCKDQVYKDSTTENAGGTSYRNTSVDIGSTADSSGLYVGWTAAGEWVDYTVNVAQAGNYMFNLRYAAVYAGATITLSSGASSVKTSLTPTATWDTWSNAVSGSLYLNAGTQTIRVTFDNGGANLNSFLVSPAMPAVDGVEIQTGTYNITAAASQPINGTIGRGLDAPLNALTNPIELYDISSWGGGSNQRWVIKPVAGERNTYIIFNEKTNKVLTLVPVNSMVANKTPLTQADLTYTNNQKWKFVANGYQSFSIVSLATSAGSNWQAVDVPDAKLINNQKLEVWSFTPGNTNQQWKLKRLY